jgi:hypothetical protein
MHREASDGDQTCLNDLNLAAQVRVASRLFLDHVMTWLDHVYLSTCTNCILPSEQIWDGYGKLKGRMARDMFSIGTEQLARGEKSPSRKWKQHKNFATWKRKRKTKKSTEIEIS